MKATIKFFESKTLGKDGAIVLELFLDSKTRPRKTIARSKTEHWNHQDKIPLKSHPDYYALYPIILEYKAKIAKIKYNHLNFDAAKVLLFSEFEKEPSIKQIGVLHFFDVIIAEKTKINQSSDGFKTVKSILSTYLDKTDVPINNITYEWLNTFIIHKKSTGCGTGGVNTYLKVLKTVYKEAQKRKSLNVKLDNPFLGLIKKADTKPVIDIPVLEFKKLHSFKVSSSTTKKSAFNMHRALAVFLFQYYIGGHDYIDVCMLEWQHIKTGRLKFKRFKNRNKAYGGPLVDNALFPQALKIIEQYGDTNTTRIFSFIPSPLENNTKYKNYRKNVNRTLASISKAVDLTEYLKTKSPRYIFRTFSGELLIHDLIVMKLQGHTPEGVTYNYQGNVSYAVLDEAHRKILNLVC